MADSAELDRQWHNTVADQTGMPVCFGLRWLEPSGFLDQVLWAPIRQLNLGNLSDTKMKANLMNFWFRNQERLQRGITYVHKILGSGKKITLIGWIMRMCSGLITGEISLGDYLAGQLVKLLQKLE